MPDRDRGGHPGSRCRDPDALLAPETLAPPVRSPHDRLRRRRRPGNRPIAHHSRRAQSRSLNADDACFVAPPASLRRSPRHCHSARTLRHRLRALQAAIPLLADADHRHRPFRRSSASDRRVLDRSIATSPETSGAVVTLLTCIAHRWQRVWPDRSRHRWSNCPRIVERKDDDPGARVGAIEINSGMMAIDGPWLRTTSTASPPVRPPARSI